MDDDPYIASCSIDYNMYKVNDVHRCYKDCPENTTSADISSVNYTINLNGVQCLQKNYVNNKMSSSDDKNIAYTKEIVDIKCNENDILIDIVNVNSKITKQCRKFTQKKEADPNKNPCPFGSELYDENTCVCRLAISSSRSEGAITKTSTGFKGVFSNISGGNIDRVLLIRINLSISTARLSRKMLDIACPAIWARLGYCAVVVS